MVYGIFACLGMCLGIFIKSSLTAFFLSLVSALVLCVGGGGFGPLSYYGDIANFLGKINPATYAIDIVRWCYFNGNTQLAGGFTGSGSSGSIFPIHYARVFPPRPGKKPVHAGLHRGNVVKPGGG